MGRLNVSTTSMCIVISLNSIRVDNVYFYSRYIITKRKNKLHIYRHMENHHTAIIIGKM